MARTVPLAVAPLQGSTVRFGLNADAPEAQNILVAPPPTMDLLRTNVPRNAKEYRSCYK